MKTLLWLAISCTIAGAAEIPWPRDFAIENTSPDGRYGILVDDRAEIGNGDLDKVLSRNYFADLKNHRIIAPIDNAWFAMNVGHTAYMAVSWTPDAKRCAIVYSARFGFRSIMLLEVEEGRLKQLNLGKTVDEEIAHLVGDAHVRWAGRDRIQVWCTATDNPKSSSDRDTHCSCFRGIYDLTDGAWKLAETRPLTEAQAELVTYVLCDPGDAPASPESAALDVQMNAVYTALYVFLPRDRFESIRKEQRQWLAATDGAAKESAKSTRLRERLKYLDKFLWAP